MDEPVRYKLLRSNVDCILRGIDFRIIINVAILNSKKKEPKDTPLLWIGWCILFVYTSLTFGDDNLINIQTPTASDNLDLTVEQRGFDQEVYFSIGGADNTIDILQTGANNTVKWTDTWGSGYSWGGDLDGTDNVITIKQNTTTGNTPATNYFGFHIQGNNNTVKFGQGFHVSDTGNFTIDNDDYGGLYMRLDIHGDYNSYIGTQRNDDSGDTTQAYINIYSDYNDIYTQQRQGDHYLSLTTNSDYNEAWITQKGEGDHQATITLGGTYGTDLYLMQQSNTQQSYSLTQTCYTVGGCSVSVTQGN